MGTVVGRRAVRSAQCPFDFRGGPELAVRADLALAPANVAVAGLGPGGVRGLELDCCLFGITFPADVFAYEPICTPALALRSGPTLDPAPAAEAPVGGGGAGGCVAGSVASEVDRVCVRGMPFSGIICSFLVAS